MSDKKKYKEYLAYLDNKVATLQTRIDSQESLVHTKYKAVSALHDIVDKIKKSDDSKAKSWWQKKVLILWGCMIEYERLATTVNTLEAFNTELVKRNELFSKKICELEAEVISLTEHLNKQI